MKRRKVLKSGLSATVGSLIASGTASSSKDQVDYDKIINKADTLLQKSRFVSNEQRAERLKKKAKRLLEKYKIRYNESVGRIDRLNSDNNISKQNRFGDPSENLDTKLVLSSFVPIEEDCSDYPCYNYGTRRMSLTWYIYETGKGELDNTCPPDGAAIFWNSDVFQPVSVGRNNFEVTNVWSTGTKGNIDVSYGEYNIRQGGVLAEVNDPEPRVDGETGVFSGGFRMKLDIVGDTPEEYPIKGKYTHTYRFAQGCTLLDYGVSLEYGGITIEPSDVKEWTMPIQEHVIGNP